MAVYRPTCTVRGSTAVLSQRSALLRPPAKSACLPGETLGLPHGDLGREVITPTTHLMKYMRPLRVTVFGANDQGGRWPQFTRDQRSLSGS